MSEDFRLRVEGKISSKEYVRRLEERMVRRLADHVGRPEEVADEMVERACRAFYAPQDPIGWVAPPVLARNMRAALEAALNLERES